MSIQIIFGVAGTGKSTYIYQQIQKQIENNKKNIKIITPEQFSFTAEKKLLETSKANSMIAAEVITFNRMAYRILQEVGGKTKVHLSSSGKAMLIDYILLTQKNDFSFLGKSDENVEMASRQITELKKHNIKVKDLKQAIENTKDKYLQYKLQDVTTLYDIYTKTIENEYIDENDGLTILAEKLEETKEFKGCDIYIDEFAGFTLQEYEILRKLMHLSNKITITICSDNLKQNTNPETDIFYANKQTAKRILDIAQQENIEIEAPVNLNEMLRFKSKNLKILAQNMAMPFYKKQEIEPENIKLFLANNPYSEIEQVAINITKLVKQGYRYEEIAVITKNIENYASLSKAIFKQYEIPVFIDEKKDFSNNLLVKWVLSLLEIFSKNWSYEAVFSYVKTGFLDLEPSQIAILENYCIKWGIKGSKWYQKEWNFYQESDEEKSQILYAKEQVVEPLLKFKQVLQGKKTVYEITKAIYEFMKEQKINEELVERIEELKKQGLLEIAEEYEASFKIFIKLLDEIVLSLGDKNITFDKYSKILKMGFNQSDLGIIPATADQVIIGDVDRSRSHKVKVAFIIGLNDGSFPSVQKDEGFLDDEDRKILKAQGLELAKTTMEQLYDDNFNIYKAFTTAEEKLYLSYNSSSSGGDSLRPSILINKIKRMFPKLKEESDVLEHKSEILLKNTTFDELLVELRALEEKPIDPIWLKVWEYYKENEPEKLKTSMNAINYKNIPETLNKENLQKLYGKKLKTSVSRLEQYKSCAFSYYLKYGLKLKERASFNVQTIDTGTFMHDVIDSFFEELDKKELKVKELTDNQVKSITEKIVEEKLKEKKYEIFNLIPKYRVLVMRLKKVVSISMKYIVDSLKYSEFEVVGHEIEFGVGKEFEPITLQLKDGKELEITGKIDRMDIAKTAERKLYSYY